MCRLQRFVPVSAAVLAPVRSPGCGLAFFTRPGKGSPEGFVERKYKDR